MKRIDARLVSVVAVTVLTVVGCGSSGGGGRATTPPPSGTSSAQAISVVALGDSDASGIGDPSGHGWVGRYTSLLERKLGVAVSAQNLAAEGKTSDELRREVATDDMVRQALAGADVILLGIGGADLNAGDDALSSGRCHGRACYAPILARFGRNISAIATQIHTLSRAGVLRAMSLPDAFPGAGNAIPSFITADVSRYQVTTEHELVCRAVHANGGRCVDIPRAFNGQSGDRDAYSGGLMTKNPCCYPSGKGQQLIAQLLLATGTQGLATGG